MVKLLLVLCAALIMLSCNKKDKDVCCATPYQIYYLKAKVTTTNDLSCGKPNLIFTDDSIRIKNITSSSAIAYTVNGLSTNLNVINKLLYVSVKVPTPQEQFICTTMGVPLPQLIVLDAKER
jgi:hypothetical protein